MIRFGIITDVQYADLDETDNRFYRASLNKLCEAIGNLSVENVEFVLQLGDAIQEDWINHQAILELFTIFHRYGIEWRHILGNHDFLVPDQCKSQIYKNFGLNRSGFYEFSIIDKADSNNKWRFIALNGNEISSYASENDVERAKAEEERKKYQLSKNVFPKPWNGSLSQIQLKWLDDHLLNATELGENVIVCSHFPLFAQSKSLKSPRTKLASLINIGVYFSDLGVSTWNGREVISIMDKYPCVKGYFAGHLHEGSYGIRNNVAHVTFKGMVEATPNAYSIVELHSDSIIIKGQGIQPSYNHYFKK